MKTQKSKHLIIILALTCVFANCAMGYKLIAWGFNSNGQCDVPDGKTYTDVAAGSYHSIALTSSGEIKAWGLNAYGQCDVPFGSGYKAISAKGHWSLAIAADGSLVAWGKNDFGQCDVPLGNDYIKIAAGVRHGLALKSDGSVVAWGNNDFGQCNVPEGSFVDVSAGLYSSFAIALDGKITSWGTNVYSMLNVPANSNAKTLSTGMYHSVAVGDSGYLSLWGSNVYGQFNINTNKKYKKASAGVFHTIALDDEGGIECAGMDFYGQCSTPDINDEWINIVSGDFHNVALVKEPVVEVQIKVTPRTLNLDSRGRWVICRVLSDQTYDTANIDLESLKLNDSVSAGRSYVNRNGDLTATFERNQLQSLLEKGTADIILTGQFNDGTKLEGYDTIKTVTNEQIKTHVKNYFQQKIDNFKKSSPKDKKYSKK